MAFGYFENLFVLRDSIKVQQELARIKSLSRMLDQVGQQEHLYEIFVDATEDLLTQIIHSIQNGVTDESFLVNAFNSEYNSNAIITHFRVCSPNISLPRPVHFALVFGVTNMTHTPTAPDECLDETESPSLPSFPVDPTRPILCDKN